MDEFEPQIRALLAVFPDIPATDRRTRGLYAVDRGVLGTGHLAASAVRSCGSGASDDLCV